MDNLQNYYLNNSLCNVCGTPLINGVCPNCTNQNILENQKSNDSRFAKFFMNPNEKLITTLGNSYVQNFLNNGQIQKGFAIVSDKRCYFQGTSYDVVYGNNGRKKLNKTNRSRAVDLKDITGTGIDYISNIILKYIGIAMAVLAFFFTLLIIYRLIVTISLGHFYIDKLTLTCGLVFLILSVIFYYLYFKSKSSIISIQYAGGEIAFDIKWFSQQEIDDFQRQLRLAKDMALEEAENVTREKYINAMSNTNNIQQQFQQGSTADELVKYADLLQKGLITQEEFDNAKRRLFNA